MAINVPAGSVVLLNYDLVHRGTRKLPETLDRFMLKFFFARTQEPTGPAWANTSEAAVDLDARTEIKSAVRDIWAWSRGTELPRRPCDVAKAAERLLHGREDERAESAYTLAEDGSTLTIDTLCNALLAGEEAARRASCYGLRSLGAVVSVRVAAALKDPRPGVRRAAAFALGTVDTARSPDCVDALARVMESDPDALARSNAGYALGQVVRAGGFQETDLLDRMLCRLALGVEGDNTTVGGLSRSTVRQCVATALIQYAQNNAVEERHTDLMLQIVLEDSDRYVRGLVSDALTRVDSLASSTRILLAGFARARWNGVAHFD